MGNIVNGTGYTIIKVKDSNNVWHTFELDHCDSKGLVEKYLPSKRLIQEALNGFITTRNDGYHIQFILNFAELSQKINSIKLADIKNYDFETAKTIYLIPRSNFPFRKFEVIEVTEEFEMGLENNSDDSMGNTGLYLVFQTKERQNKYKWYDVDAITIVKSTGYVVI